MSRAILLLLILVVVASNLIVELWDYRDAPSEIKWALIVGAAGVLVLGLLVGIPLTRRRL